MKKSLFGVAMGATVGLTLWARKRYLDYDPSPIHIRPDKPTLNERINPPMPEGFEQDKVFHPKVNDWGRFSTDKSRDRHYCGEIHNLGDSCIEDLFLDERIGITPFSVESVEYKRLEQAKKIVESDIARLQRSNDEIAEQLLQAHVKQTLTQERLDAAREALGLPKSSETAKEVIKSPPVPPPGFGGPMVKNKDGEWVPVIKDFQPKPPEDDKK